MIVITVVINTANSSGDPSLTLYFFICWHLHIEIFTRWVKWSDNTFTEIATFAPIVVVTISADVFRLLFFRFFYFIKNVCYCGCY